MARSSGNAVSAAAGRRSSAPGRADAGTGAATARLHHAANSAMADALRRAGLTDPDRRR